MQRRAVARAARFGMTQERSSGEAVGEVFPNQAQQPRRNRRIAFAGLAARRAHERSRPCAVRRPAGRPRRVLPRACKRNSRRRSAPDASPSRRTRAERRRARATGFERDRSSPRFDRRTGATTNATTSRVPSGTRTTSPIAQVEVAGIVRERQVEARRANRRRARRPRATIGNRARAGCCSRASTARTSPSLRVNAVFDVADRARQHEAQPARRASSYRCSSRRKSSPAIERRLQRHAEQRQQRQHAQCSRSRKRPVRSASSPAARSPSATAAP